MLAKDIFKKHQAQTFPFPSCLEIESAKGSYIYDVNGKAYLDFVAGVSACSFRALQSNYYGCCKRTTR